MRINIYSQELTNEVKFIEKRSVDVDIVYSAVQLILHSSDKLHHRPPYDDDRSAITIWLPKSPARREELAATLVKMADLVLAARPSTGLD